MLFSKLTFARHSVESYAVKNAQDRLGAPKIVVSMAKDLSGFEVVYSET